MIHLDTSFLIRGSVSGSTEDRALRGWVGAREVLGVSTVAWAEFLCGPYERSSLEFLISVIDRYVDFSSAHTEIAAHLFNQSGRRRGSQMDCMIAATAIAEKAPIATSDTRDFRRFETEGLTFALA